MKKICDELRLVEYKIEYKKWDIKFSFIYNSTSSIIFI